MLTNGFLCTRNYMIKIKNSKLKDYLLLKDQLVAQGRKMSADIEALDLEIEALNNDEKEITVKVNPEELIKKGEDINAQIQTLVTELEAVVKEIQDIKIKAIPKDMYDRHYALRDKKEKLERERNKIALKIQKIKDRVVPIITKEVKPKLKEFEDIEKTEIVGDEIVVTLFDRLEEFKKTFKKG